MEREKVILDKEGSKQITGFASIDKPWLKFYREDAEKQALNIPNNKSLWDVLEKKLIEFSDIPALEYFKKEISRPDFIKSVELWARTFKAMGVQEEEIVPIYGPFFPDICAMTCALNSIGAISYFLKLEISEQALREETADAKIAVVYDGMWQNVKNVFMDDKFKKIIVATAADSMIHPKKEILTFMNYIKAKQNNYLIPKDKKYIWVDEAKKIADYYTGNYRAEFKPNKVAFITSSSGTSLNGVVKGTMATNEAAIYQLYKASAADVNYNAGKKCLTNLPPTASTSLNCLFFLPLYKGMTVINEPRLSEFTYYNQVMSYKPQVALMTGSFWESFFRKLELDLKKGKRVNLDYFEMPIIGGEGVTPESLKWMNDLMKKCGSPVSMFNGYGMSEVFSVLSVEKLGANAVEGLHKPVISVGLPYPGVNVGIFDENGKEVSYNNRGELWIKDPSNMQGYYNKEDLTKSTLIDGWIRTDDIAEIDKDGFLYIFGRKGNVLNVDENTSVYLFDIENKIREDKDVKEAMVNVMPLTDGKKSLVAHILFNDKISSSKEEVYERIDGLLSNYLPQGVIIDGYKEHHIAFPISPTTAKKDRKGMIKDTKGYIKVIDGEVYHIDYEYKNDAYIIEQKAKEKNKTLTLNKKEY